MPYLLLHLKLKKTQSHRASEVLKSDSGLPAVSIQATSDFTNAAIPVTDLNTPRLRFRPQGDTRHHQTLPELPKSTGAKGHLWDRHSQVCNCAEFQFRVAFFFVIIHQLEHISGTSQRLIKRSSLWLVVQFMLLILTVPGGYGQKRSSGLYIRNTAFWFRHATVTEHAFFDKCRCLQLNCNGR